VAHLVPHDFANALIFQRGAARIDEDQLILR
jgi:hypothetical protein